MSAPRARFLATTHTMREILALLVGIRAEEISRVVVNPYPEDVDGKSDRIHAILADGRVSETVIITEPDGITLEKPKGVDAFPSWGIAQAAEAFVRSVRAEIAGPALEADESAIEPRAVATNGSESNKIAGERLPIPKTKRTPKARFRTTVAAIGRLSASFPKADGIRGFVVNPNPEEIDENEDRIHALLDDGTLSSACLYCAPSSYAVADAQEVEEDLPLQQAAQAFFSALRNEMDRQAIPSLH